MPPPASRRRPHRVAGALLVLLVLGFHLDLTAPTAPGALLELILPGAFMDAADVARPVLGATPPAAGRNLVARALLSDAEPPTRAALYVGLAPLLLALMAALSARGTLATLARVALLVGLTMLVGWIQAGPIGATMFIAALAGLAGLGLAALFDDRAGAGTPALALGAAAVLVAAVIGAYALEAGAVTDAEVTGPWLRRLPPGQAEGWSATALAGNAAHWRAVLDRSALAAFAVMTALLLHLKGRARWSLVLLLLVVAADLLSARFG